MEKIEYSDEFICPKCGCHTGLSFNLDGTVQAHCFRCNSYYDVKIKKETNGDRIRAMTDGELAEWLAELETKCYLRLDPLLKCSTEQFARDNLKWLKQECDT